jgi:hypothetical protein
VKDLLAVEREAPPPSRAAEQRVRARVAASVVAAGAVGVAGTAGATTAAAGATAKAAGAGALGSAIGVKASLIAVAIAAGATATGGYVVHQRRTQALAPAAVVGAHADRRASVAVGIEAPAPPTAEPAAAEAPAVSASDPAPARNATDRAPAGDPGVQRRISAAAPIPAETRRRPVTRQAATDAAEGAPSPAGLTEENVPIAAALSALANGAPASAIAALEQHARRFPAGQLEEEREALWIQALAAAGAADEARARADRFRRRFPDSIQRDAVAAALAKIP